MTDLDSQRSRQSNCFQRSCALGCHRQQQRVVAGDRPQFLDMRRRRVEHQRRIMRAVKAGFARNKWSLNVPAHNGGLQFSRSEAQCPQMPQPRRELRPFIRDQSWQKLRATGSPKLSRRREQFLQA